MAAKPDFPVEEALSPATSIRMFFLRSDCIGTVIENPEEK